MESFSDAPDTGDKVFFSSERKTLGLGRFVAMRLKATVCPAVKLRALCPRSVSAEMPTSLPLRIHMSYEFLTGLGSHNTPQFS